MAAILLTLAPILPGHPAVGAEAVRYRDIITTAFQHPFITDAVVDMYFSDERGRVTCDGRPTLIRYPAIREIGVDGKRLGGQQVEPDLLRVELPAGTHDIEIVAGGQGRNVSPDARVADPGTVATVEAFDGACRQLQPGDELVVRDGTYRDWRLQLSGRGTAERPITIRPETPGGVTFTAGSEILVSGEFLVLKGFRFEHCGPGTALRLLEASDSWVTQCHFVQCGGNPASSFSGVLVLDMGCHRDQIDHCYFTGSSSISIQLRVRGLNGYGTDNRIDGNVFRDIHRTWNNGLECIQPGGGEEARLHCLVEGNLFDHAWGDSEIISNKSSENVYRRNVASHCPSAGFSLRVGDDVRFEGNVAANCGAGVLVLGRRHAIVNNLIVAQDGPAIGLLTGAADASVRRAPDDCIVAHNTIVNCLAGIVGGGQTDVVHFLPQRPVIQNNLVVGDFGRLIDTRYLGAATVRRNLVWATAAAEAGDAGDEAILEDPCMEGEGLAVRPAADGPGVDRAIGMEQVTVDIRGRARPQGEAPDVGAEEIGAADPTVPLPPIPPRPLLAPQLHKGARVLAYDSAEPLRGWEIGEGAVATDGSIVLRASACDLEASLPPDFVLVWEYRPEGLDSRASLTFSGDTPGDGAALSWGGKTDDGKPRWLVEARRPGTEEVVADGPDIVAYLSDYPVVGSYATQPDTRTAPDPTAWYRFTLLWQDGRAIVLLGDGRRPDSDPVPILIWRGHASGADWQLRIKQEQEAGSWRGFRAWEYAYPDDGPPPPPADLTAKAFGEGRVLLRWDSDYPVDIHRGAEPGFRPNETNRIARRIYWPGYDDFAIEPQTTYHYRVQAVSPLGAVSECAEAAVTTGLGGPLYRLIRAEETRALESPMVLDADRESGRSFVWAPFGVPCYTEAPAAEGSAEFAFDVPAAGRHALWALVLAPDGMADSFYWGIDLRPGDPFRGCSTGLHPRWGWSRLSAPETLTEGEHVLTLKNREAGTRVSTIVLTDDLNYLPGER
ncbi:MAG: right-handed parallel beta-helix repeat-containing protein [Gemmatimonadetes bacterium]|nr:right-handed parallel beta-helix repeat-containing protein [Gemmatimonadota bacterium]